MAARVIRSLATAACLGLLSACASSLPNYETRGVHVVQPGETLYTIAWRHGLDYRELARWNGLSNPDFIVVGQRIALTPGAAGGGAASATPTARAEPARNPQPSRTAAPTPLPQDPAPGWHWPTPGRVVSAFGTSNGLGNGIGIAGELGQRVNAAAAGRVVYAGSGLIGYGQLVIVKHNDTYLSAYGHNQRLLVGQGDTVAAGQQIAEMGLGPQREPRLHFEIRRNGQPLDPLTQVRPR